MIDAATLQVWISRLTGVADEMGAVLRRAAYSPNIKERADCSCALFTPDGTLLVQAEHIPVHLGAMPAAVRAAIDACGAEIGAGEQIVVNDPFAGGTHLNDITFVAPVYTSSGALAGWVANRAHHADVGGMAPGSIPPDATEIQQEGLRIPPVRWTPEVEAIVVAASRTPDERRGDLDAQTGANRLGIRRLLELAPEPAILAEIVDVRRASHARRARFASRRLVLLHRRGRLDGRAARQPAGAHRGDGDHRGGHHHLRLHGHRCAACRRRERSDRGDRKCRRVRAAHGRRSRRCPRTAARSAPVRVIAPPGSIVAARLPVAVGAGNVEVSQRVADVCLGALAQAAPAAVGAASQGTMNNVIVGGTEPAWVYYETIGGGQGGRPGPRPGMNGVHTAMTNTRDTPVEALERAYPLRVRRYGLRRGSGGAGAAPGGDGIERELEVLVAATLSLVTERRTSSPWGLAGGAPGAPGENWLLPGGDESRRRRGSPTNASCGSQPGDVVRILTPGGGGFGVPPD